MAGPVPAAIDHEQRLAGVGQREDQRVVSPLALVIDVHALLAFAAGLDHRAVGLEDGFREELLGLLTPDFQPRGVEDRLQAEDVRRLETAAEVARRGRVRNAARPQGIEVRLVAAQQFQVFQAGSSGQQVVSDVQHVVGIVVGQMDFQQPKVTVDRLIEPHLLREQVHGTDAAGSGCPRAIDDFIVDVRGGHDRLVAPAVVVLVQPAGDPPLASFDLSSYLGIHSKTSVLRAKGCCCYPLYVRKCRRFSSFFVKQPRQALPGSLV